MCMIDLINFPQKQEELLIFFANRGTMSVSFPEVLSFHKLIHLNKNFALRSAFAWLFFLPSAHLLNAPIYPCHFHRSLFRKTLLAFLYLQSFSLFLRPLYSMKMFAACLQFTLQRKGCALMLLPNLSCIVIRPLKIWVCHVVTNYCLLKISTIFDSAR